MNKAFLEEIKKKVGKNKYRVVFTEGEDQRIQEASAMLAKDKIITPILLGDKAKILASFDKLKIKSDNIEIIEVNENYQNYQKLFSEMVELRKGKMTEEEVKKSLAQANYFGTMLVKIGDADALLGGATYSTADTVRPALQLIKCRPGEKIVSSCFLMLKDDKRLIFADCALNLFPSSDELACIAKQSVITARQFGINPKVALLSYSTKGSGKGEAVDKVVAAHASLTNENVDFLFDGELQVDAALVPSVASLKAPNSIVAGEANVLIFPDINSGNIGYKLTERLGGYEALGPILQGLNAPICDLSRGCKSTDIYQMAYITVSQK